MEYFAKLEKLTPTSLKSYFSNKNLILNVIDISLKSTYVNVTILFDEFLLIYGILIS